jgi:hypothetical protein
MRPIRGGIIAKLVPLIPFGTDRIENTVSNSSSIVVVQLLLAKKMVPSNSCCLVSFKVIVWQRFYTPKYSSFICRRHPYLRLHSVEWQDD